MHTHTVFFWLWKSASREDREIFKSGLNHLMKDPNVRHCVIGEPARTNREVVDNSYDFGCVVTFDSTQDHNLYQIGQHHEDFLEQCKHLWSRVQVFDIEN